MTERVANVLEIIGLCLLSIAGWLVAPALGIAIAGLACIALAVLLSLSR